MDCVHAEPWIRIAVVPPSASPAGTGLAGLCETLDFLRDEAAGSLKRRVGTFHRSMAARNDSISLVLDEFRSRARFLSEHRLQLPR